MNQTARQPSSTDSRRVALVFNTNAASNGKRAPQLLPQLNGFAGIKLYATQTLSDLEQAADEICSYPPSHIAISGGDGTISHTITALRKRMGKQLPPIALLRGGSMNMVANSIGAPKDILAFATFLNNGGTLKTVSRDTMHISGHFGFIFGLGLVPNFLEAYYAGNTTGPARAAAVVSKVIGSTIVKGQLSKQVFRRRSGRLRCGPLDQIRDWTVILVETIRNLGIGFEPCYRATDTPGTFHALGGDISPTRFVQHLSYVYKGRPWPKKLNMIDLVESKLQFNATEPFAYTIDGELLTSDGSITVEIDQPTQFVLPAS